MARFDSLAEFMDGSCGRVTIRNGGRFFMSWGTRILPFTLRAGRKRPGNDTRILSALSELTASIRFRTRSHISNRISRRPTKYCSARDNDPPTGLRMNELKILATCCALLVLPYPLLPVSTFIANRPMENSLYAQRLHVITVNSHSSAAVSILADVTSPTN